MPVRINSLIGLGLLAVLTAGCRDTHDGITTAPDGPLHSVSERVVYVAGGTFQRGPTGGTYFASYSAGEVIVEAISGSTATALGQVDATWGNGEYFTEPAGSALRLTASLYGGQNCTFRRWVVDNATYSTTNPISISTYSTAEEFLAEFLCYA